MGILDVYTLNDKDSSNLLRVPFNVFIITFYYLECVNFSYDYYSIIHALFIFVSIQSNIDH